VRRDFVANVSHELKTPLTVVAGFAETLAEHDVSPEQRRQFARAVLANASRMQRIVDDLLDLSRIESGGWVPNPVEQSVGPIASEVLGPLQDRANAKGVRLVTRIDDGAATVYADETAVRQILSNLTENALRHTQAGEVELFSTLDGGGIRLGVRDTGSGIAAEHLPRVFERFYRADPGRSREAGGTGLGLSIVKHMAEAHGGRVIAESVVGEGTTISVLFPASPEDAPAED